MRERLLEDWLTKVGERGFEIPFSQLLVAQGHKILRVGHSPIEHGKDVISIDSHGLVHVYQLKSGPIGLTEWEKIVPQVTALVETGPNHPNVEGRKFIPHLVTTGEFSIPALSRISAHNAEWKKRKRPKLELISGKQLLPDFARIASDFWPAEMPDLRAFISLFHTEGHAFIDKKGYTDFFLGILAVKSRKKTDVARQISALNIFVSYLLSSAYERENHWAITEAWTLAASAVAWAADKHALPKKYWLNSFNLAVTAARSGVSELTREALVEKALDPRKLEWDEITRVRNTIVAGVVAISCLMEAKDGSATESKALELIRRIVSQRRTVIWGESAIPFYFAMILFLQRHSSDRLDEVLLVSLISNIAKNNSRRSARGLPDPYQDPDSLMVNIIERLSEGDRETRTNVGQSYSIESLIRVAARRLLRTQLEAMWRDISYVGWKRFKPTHRRDLLLWETSGGTSLLKQPEKTQSWSALLKAARALDPKGKLPEILCDRSDFALLFLLVYPHRFSPELVDLCDQNAFG